MQNKYKYLKNLNSEFQELLLQNSDLEEKEYIVLKDSISQNKGEYREKTCKKLYMSISTYRNIKDRALSKVHLVFCTIMRNAFKN